MGKSFNKNMMASNPIVNPSTRDPRTVLARDQVQDFNDPYLPEGSYPDNTICSECGAVWHNQHWNWNDSLRDTLVAAGTPNEVVCPGCRITASRDPQGVVTLKGDYWLQHETDIINLIRNEEDRGTNTNPLERIIDIRREGDILVVETTTEKLAQRIGRAVHSAHKGDVEYKWSDGNQLVRVYWERRLETNGHKK